MPSSVPDFGCETFVSIPEEGSYIIFIGSAYSVLPRIAWGLIWSYPRDVILDPQHRVRLAYNPECII